MDALGVVEDEVALEGLDGITVSSLWIRLGNRKQPFPLKLDDSTKGFIWRYLVSNTELKFYKLPEERHDVVLFDRFATEMRDGERKEIYPLHIIRDDKDGLQGSCSTFDERRDVTNQIRSKAQGPLLGLSEAAERYGSKLVVVASQPLRFLALLGPDGDPDVKLCDESYCILERVGRSRWQGEVQSDMHSSWFRLDARKFHYIRKPLMRHKLVSMQSYVIRQHVGQHKHSILLLLKRFYVNRRSKYDILAERASNILSQMPVQFATFSGLRQQLQVNERTLKRLLGNMKEAKCVQNIRIPMEDLDKEGGPCVTKKGNKVMVRGFKLMKPFESKCGAADEDEDDDEEDEEDPGKRKSGLPAAARIMEMDVVSQSYYYILSCGTKGVSKSYVAAKMNIGKLESRMVCRRLEKDGLIKGFMEDVGRQRTTRFISHKCVGGSNHLRQLSKEQERQKILCSDMHAPTTPKQGGKNEKAASAKKGKRPTKKEAAKTHEREEANDIPEKTANVTEKESEGNEDPEVKASTCSTQPSSGEGADSTSSTDNGEHNQDDMRSAESPAVDEQDILPPSETAMEGSDQAKNVVMNVVDSLSDKLPQPSKKSLDKSKDTYRVLKRKNTIIEAVQSLKVIAGLFPLQKLINEEEKADGSSTICCKKTVWRLVTTLAREGLLKIYSTTVIQDGSTKKVDIVVHPSIQPKDPLVSSVIDQVRFRLTGGTPTSRSSSRAEDEVDDKEYSEMTGCVFKSQKCMGTKKKEDVKEEQFKPTRVRGLGRSLGFQPKMHRLHVVHAFLWYVIYGQQKPEDPLPQNKSTEKTPSDSLASETPASDQTPPEEDVEQDESTSSVCSKSEEDGETWKKFIPPLRCHEGYSLGWAMISDLLLCMPLSIFIQIIQINYKVDGLEDYINDPVKQHHLVRDMPPKMRRQLLYKRKYIFSFHENLQKLTYMGLLQFGPNLKFYDKDHVFVHLKRNATIVDTTSSEPHYWLVAESPDKPFERRHYQFNTSEDVENYWFDLMCVCLNTPLGVFRHQRGENETPPSFYNDRNVFVGMAHLLKGSLDVCDDASTPGDGKGAAGLDSEFFSHLKRNWLWTNHLLAEKDKKSSDSSQVKHKIRLKSLMSKNLLHLVTKAGNATNPRYITPMKSVIKEEDVEVATEPASRNKKVVGGKNQKRKRTKKEVVKVPRKKKKESQKPSRAHDEVDHRALKMMTSQRVIWKLQEDSVILLANVASYLLNSKLKKPFIWYCVLRDMLHAELTFSLDKTSLAVGRRSKYIMKNPQTLLNYRICLAEVNQDTELKQQLEENIPADPENSDDCAKSFTEYIRLLRLKFSSLTSSSNLSRTFDTKEELFSKFQVCAIGNKNKAQLNEVISSRADIHTIVLQNLIQSTLSMNNLQMRSLRSFQTFHMYNQYNQELLCQVFLQCRKRGLVNRRRVGRLRGLGPKKNRAVPILPMSYQLSQKYYRTFSWRFPTSLCTDCHRFVKSLSSLGARDDRRTLSINHEGELGSREAASQQMDGTEEMQVDSGEEAKGPSVVEQAEDFHPGGEREEVAASQEQEPTDMLTYSMESPGGSCLAAVSLMTLGLVSLHLSIPKQMVVVDSQLVDKDVVKSVLEDDDDDDRDEPVGKKIEVKAHQASHTKYLMMQGCCIPGIVKNRNLNTSDSIVVESCVVRLQLRNTPSHTVFGPDDFRPHHKAGPSLLPPAVTRFVRGINSPCGQEWKTKLSERGYSPRDVEECALVRSDLDEAGEVGMEEQHFLHVHSRLLALQGGRTRTLHQYMKDLQEDEQVLRVGGLCFRWVLMKHADSWLLVIPSNKWQPRAEDPYKTRRPRKRSRRGTSKEPEEPTSRRLSAGEEDGGEPGRAVSATEGETQQQELQEEEEPVMAEKPVDDHEEDKEGAADSKPEEAATETTESDENTLQFIGRPWRMTDGKLNRPVCKGMLEGVLQHIMTCPGITLQTLLDHYKRVTQPVVLQELLQVLEDVGCVTRRTLIKKPKPSLFSRSTRRDAGEQPQVFQAPDAVFYEPTVSCYLRLARMFPNERQWSYVTS